MGLWDGIKRLFGLRPPKRKLAGLAGESSDLDVISEAVDLSGEPLKTHRLRVTYRDPRLLPKRRPVWPLKPPTIFTRDEAERLFSRSQRTKDRRIRDLASDPEQLQRHGLPPWSNESELAEALGLTVARLHYFACHRLDDRHEHYVRFAVPKRTGGERIILAPKRELKALQRTVHKLLVSQLAVSDFAFAFVSQRNTRGHAAPHQNQVVVLKMDLKDFFGSITFRRVRGYLIAMGYSYPVATTLALLCTEAERQPVSLDDGPRFVPVSERYCVQGAPTSPGFANAIASKLDHRLAGLAKSRDMVYSRYADDLAFSGDSRDVALEVRKVACKIIRSEGFVVNHKKTRVMTQASRQQLTGVTVNQDVGLSRTERRALRALIHQHGDDPSRHAEIRGKLAYLAMLNPEQADRLRGRWSQNARQTP